MPKSRSKKARQKERQTREAGQRKARRRPTENTAKRATWAGLLLDSGQELRDHLPIDESAYTLVAATAHADARAYFGYSVCEEILAGGAAIYRWLKLLVDMEKDGAENDRFWMQSILDEQNLRIRKLVEVLLELICFRETNEQPYYQHLALLHELSNLRGTQQDLKEFYACDSRNIAAQFERFAAELEALEASSRVDLGRCWYSKSSAAAMSAVQFANLSPGQQLSSARTRLKGALLIAEGREKLALGMSYDRLYSRTSRHIHFSPESELEVDVAAVARATDECGILGLNVVVALQWLLGDAPGETNEQVRRALEENPYPTQLSEELARGTASVGDFVLAYGDVAEVLDSTESSYGYRSHKVLYLAGAPMPAIQEDWLPAQSVRLMWSRNGIEEEVLAAMADGDVSDAVGRQLLSAQGQEAFRAALRELWDQGLRAHVLGRGGQAA